MEHRWHPRSEVDFSVVIFHDGVPVACGRALNLSAGGLLLQPGADSLVVNAPVEVEFSVRVPNGPQRVRIPAQIVHQSAHGTGVMFDNHRTDARQRLDRVVGHFLPPANDGRAHTG